MTIISGIWESNCAAKFLASSQMYHAEIVLHVLIGPRFLAIEKFSWSLTDKIIFEI